MNPASTVVTIGSPGPISKSQVNTLAVGTTQQLSTVGRISATQNGSPMAAGASINVTISSSDKSGTTCLVYVANGATTGTPCTYPAANSTPAPVTISHVNDGIEVQYNDGPSAPGGTFNISGNVPGASTQPTAVVMNNPNPLIAHTTSGNVEPWGGGVVYDNGVIYFTQNSTTNPIGMVAYANGAAASGVANMTVAGLTNAPAGGLIVGPDGNLWGTEQNATKAFEVSPAGGAAVEYNLTCPSGSQSGGSTQLLGPQTGITSGNGKVYVLCANVASAAAGNASASADNTINTITPGTANATQCTAGSFGAFANGAIYSNGVIYTEEGKGSGANSGGYSIGEWLSVPLSNCSGGFAESSVGGNTRGDGSLALMSDGNLYSMTDGSAPGVMASTSFSGVTAASATNPPTFYIRYGGGGLVQDTILGSGAFFGTSDSVDLNMLSKWTGGTRTSLSATGALTAGGLTSNAGECEVALNNGGATGIVTLPDGKLAWPAATDGQETARNWLCIANL